MAATKAGTTPSGTTTTTTTTRSTTSTDTTTTNSATTTTPNVVQATMNYVDGEKDYYYIGRKTSGDDSGSIQAQEHIVSIENVRLRRNHGIPEPTLQLNGVELVHSPIHNDNNNKNDDNDDNDDDDKVDQSSSSSSFIDFLDRVDVLKRYYPHCEELVRNHLTKEALSSSSSSSSSSLPTIVRAFDHNVRITGGGTDQDRTTFSKTAGVSKIQNPLQMVHGDYTAISAPRRLHDLSQPAKINDVWREVAPNGLLNEELVQQALVVLEQSTQDDDKNDDENDDKDKNKQNDNDNVPIHSHPRRFAIINVWRNIDRIIPVQSFPLACVDATTVIPTQDLRILQIQYPDRIGENYLAVYNPKHDWLYWDSMTHDEVLLIKQWDSYGTDVQYQKLRQSPQGQEQKQQEAQSSTYSNNTNDDYISTFSIHSAFDHDDTLSTIRNQKNESTLALSNQQQEQFRERRSIEVRCVVIY